MAQLCQARAVPAVELISEAGLLLLAAATAAVMARAWWYHHERRVHIAASAVGVGPGLPLERGRKAALRQARPCAVWQIAGECPPPGDWSLPSNHATLGTRRCCGDRHHPRTVVAHMVGDRARLRRRRRAQSRGASTTSTTSPSERSSAWPSHFWWSSASRRSCALSVRAPRLLRNDGDGPWPHRSERQGPEAVPAVGADQPSRRC